MTLYEALKTNNYDEAHQILESGEGNPLPFHEGRALVYNHATGYYHNPLICLANVWDVGSPELVNLLVVNGAGINTVQDKIKWKESINFVVSYGTDHEGLPFDNYMPFLKALAKHNLLTPGMIEGVACHASEPEQIKAQLLQVSGEHAASMSSSDSSSSSVSRSSPAAR